MSADNWTVCPNCKAKAQVEMRSLEEQLDAAYGKVSKKEYQAIADKLKGPHVKLEDTLREDWELGIYNDKFFVNYSAGCQVCGWDYHFNFEDKNPLEVKNGD